MRESDERTKPTNLAIATHALLRAYPGPFLEQDFGSWTIETRDRLRDRYVKSLEEIGNYWETLGDRTMARACCERGLEVKMAAK